MFLNTALKFKNIRIMCTIPCHMTNALYSQYLQTYMYITIDTVNQYWIKINILVIAWTDFMRNWFQSRKYRKLVILIGILFFTQCINIRLPTNISIFHSKSYVATFQCWYYTNVSIYEHDLSTSIEKIQEDMNICNILLISWKIRVVWLIFTMPYPSIRQFLGVKYMQFYWWNPTT